MKDVRCKAITYDGTRCTKKGYLNGYCLRHNFSEHNEDFDDGQSNDDDPST